MHSGNAQNDSGWVNEEYDALLDAAAIENDPATRAKFLQDAELILLQEAPLMRLKLQ